MLVEITDINVWHSIMDVVWKLWMNYVLWVLNITLKKTNQFLLMEEIGVPWGKHH
jgi:hypothetical protein